jgi:hypothetical protein
MMALGKVSSGIQRTSRPLQEIRYTGLELGSGAYRPTPPAEVLRRRYGDCKDKTLLAVLVSANVEFDLRAGLDQEAEASLGMSTVYRGSEADNLRRTLRRETAAELGTGYVNSYKRQYSGIRALGAPQVTDELGSNKLTVSESYRIEHPFETDDSGKKHFAVERDVISAHLRTPAAPARTMPFALEHPVDSSEHIRVRMPQPFPVKDEVVKIEAAASFHYDSRVSHAGNDVLLEYRYRTVTDTVPREVLEEFLKKRAAAHDDTYFTFTTGTREEPLQAKAAEAAQQLERAGRLAQGGQIDKTDEVLKVLLASAGFRRLTAPQQHAALYLSGAVALQRADAARALDLQMTQ